MFKIPFHIISWKTINIESFKISMTLVPFVLLGLLIGVKVVEKFNDESYRKLILFFTAIGGLGILIT